jgi:hypothetical protein
VVEPLPRPAKLRLVLLGRREARAAETRASSNAVDSGWPPTDDSLATSGERRSGQARLAHLPRPAPTTNAKVPIHCHGMEPRSSSRRSRPSSWPQVVDAQAHDLDTMVYGVRMLCQLACDGTRVLVER